MGKKTVKATVRVVVDVEADSTWSSDTSFDQISSQAEDGVRNLLTGGNKLLAEEIPRRIRSIEFISVRVYKAD